MLTRTVRFSSLKRWPLEVVKRRGMKRAKVALARKLATVLRLWTDSSEFLFGKKAAKAFDENGIGFAFPTVQLAGGEPGLVAAQAALDNVRQPAA